MATKVKSQKLKVKSLQKSDSGNDVQTLRKELQGLMLEHAQFKLKNTSLITLTRKKIARALTIKNIKERRADEMTNV